MKTNILILIFLIPLNIFCQVSWPISPFNTQHTLTGKVGEYRNTNRFHKGIDIIGNSSVVYATENGIVEEITNVGTSTEQVRVGDLWYTHVVSDVSINDNVVAGETLIGTMYSENDFPIHIHLEDNTRNLLHNNLSPYVDLTAPTIEAISFRRNGHSLNNATEVYTEVSSYQQNNYTIIYNKLDIVVNASDPEGNYIHAPENDQLSFTVHNANTWEFQAFTLNGSLVYQSAGTIQGNEVNVWDGAGVASGFYDCIIKFRNSCGELLTNSYLVYNAVTESNKLTVQKPLGNKKENTSLKPFIHIFPNPNNALFTLSVSNNTLPFKVRCINSLGKLVYEKHNILTDSHRIDLGTAPAGVYLLKVIFKNKEFCKKLIIK
jgi:hypothetical protein